MITLGYIRGVKKKGGNRVCNSKWFDKICVIQNVIINRTGIHTYKLKNKGAVWEAWELLKVPKSFKK